jgi:tetraacyldisaccharide 4'-kinase
VPVVSVGNLTLGGTGKTPCVEYVAGFYRDLGHSVAILSRGYGAEAGRNDEAMILEENLPDVPHLQGVDRVGLARTAIEELDRDTLVLDDGFQHRQLARDLDIVTVDATRPLQQEYLFPRGLLREPLSGLSRAGIAVLTRTDQARPESLEAQRRWLQERFPTLPVAMSEHAPVALIGNDECRELSELLGKPVAAFCGIGNPEAFRNTLTNFGANLISFRVFPDHHRFTRADVDDLRTWAASMPADAVVATTQKDLVKLRLTDLSDRPLWALRVGMRFTEGEGMVQEKLRSVTRQLTND